MERTFTLSMSPVVWNDKSLPSLANSGNLSASSKEQSGAVDIQIEKRLLNHVDCFDIS